MPPEETDLPRVAQPTGPDAVPGATARRHGPLRPHLDVLAVIAVGGALGAVARFEAARLWPTDAGAFPWTTMTVNAVGCLVIGVFLVAVTEVFPVHRLLRPFFGTGVLGGFTTFSTYSVDIERLVGDGHAGLALTYLAATLAAALSAVSTGAWVARRFLAKWSER
ncbi:fluoride efflux transporter CrcB [Streptomyces sp. B1I3]|uniref:fluoride efflux transporter CrcB n=1 Tax=Streptomyces sp. B1I3 TaxID=3042264 RepID=UPI002782E5C6|nr:fluoride efflux transporter CrcB [Streptomyces sp. B1I3]MDQ0792655.1 CrcB protein [Streptomyces sp. B1I3]